ncbi:PREDICTED: putative F-box protein At3g23960 [Camelina sativa]|uniref:F-box protein At3g23960 n=1 Tax=Camelina sativa TaxID=90675 RepID=A0ABM0T032_CAMSA|nr:PREDICTED: putative F-box protein At3g23960 [Camelina sativa]
MTSIDNSFPIPIDLVIEILARLQAKYIGRCRCVSKLWANILCRQDFTELFLTKSFARPQLLFACLMNDSGLSFFSSSHQPQKILTAIDTTYLTHVPKTYQVCGTINGLICLKGIRIFKGCMNPASALVLCNPTTRESLPLPKMKTTRRKENDVKSYFGYVPTEKQFKVLSMTLPVKGNSEGHQVLTFRTDKKLSWRMITRCIPHRPDRNWGICISGVLYYTAVVIEESLEVITVVVCFDFGSEKFSVLKVMETFKRTLPNTTTPVNYNGKLGLLMTEESNWVINGISRYFELWVLEDAGKHEWSNHEIVLSYHPTMPHYVFYYNIERDTVRVARIRGMEGVKGNGCRIFLNHVETVELIQNILVR